MFMFDSLHGSCVIRGGRTTGSETVELRTFYTQEKGCFEYKNIGRVILVMLRHLKLHCLL